MQINIHPNVTARYPDYLMGVIEASIIRYDLDKLHKTIAAQNDDVKLPIRNFDAQQKWMQVFTDMNASAKRLPSVIALWNLQERFGELRSINFFVDAYNHISTKYGIPMGGYDLLRLSASDITLRYASRGDKFHPLGLNQIEKIRDESEIVYYSGSDVICRYWNNKDSELTKITEETEKLLIIFDTFLKRDKLQEAMNELASLLNATSEVAHLEQYILSTEKTVQEIQTV